MATIAHKVILFWLCLLVTLVVAVLKLDDKIDGNWFYVFIPQFFIDIIMLICLLLFVINVYCRIASYAQTHPAPKTAIAKCLACILLKVLFEILLCIKLQYIPSMGSYIVMAPVWLLCLTAIAELSLSLFADRGSTQGILRYIGRVT